MGIKPARGPLSDSGALWFAISAVGSVGGGGLAQKAGSSVTIAARGTATPGEWALLLAGLASILVAGLCIWIVTWEDSDEKAAESANGSKPQASGDQPK